MPRIHLLATLARRTVLPLVLLGLASFEMRGAEKRAFAQVQPLELRAAKWTDGFWAERFAVCRTQTVPVMWRLMSGTEYSSRQGGDDHLDAARSLKQAA